MMWIIVMLKAYCLLYACFNTYQSLWFDLIHSMAFTKNGLITFLIFPIVLHFFILYFFPFIYKRISNDKTFLTLKIVINVEHFFCLHLSILKSETQPKFIFISNIYKNNFSVVYRSIRKYYNFVPLIIIKLNFSLQLFSYIDWCHWLLSTCRQFFEYLYLQVIYWRQTDFLTCSIFILIPSWAE